MDDKSRPHRARIVQEKFAEWGNLRHSVAWLSPDLNPIEHVWDQIGKNIDGQDPPCQNHAELGQDLVNHWQLVPETS